MSDSPKPAFPAWLRRIDPTLEAEDQNVLFKVYRRRRMATASSWKAHLRLPEADAPWIIALVGSLLILLMLGVCAIPLIGGWLALLPRLWGHRKLSSQRMPRRVGGAFSAMGYHPQAATDLWLAGATGSVVVEAIYLEHRERTWRPIILTVVAVWILVFWIAFSHNLQGGLSSLFVAATTGIVAWQVLLLLLVRDIRWALDFRLDPMIASWRDAPKTSKSFMVGMSEALRWAAFVPIFAVLGVIGTFLAFQIERAMMDTHWGRSLYAWPAFLRGNLSEWIGGAELLGVALLFSHLRKDFLRTFEASLRICLWHSTEAFDAFFSRCIMADPQRGSERG